MNTSRSSSHIMNSEKILDISWASILKVLLVIFVAYLIYQVRDILVLFIFAVIISILFTPAIDFLKKIRIPRALAVIFLYLSTFIIISLIAYFTIHFFINEIHHFSRILPYYFDRLTPFLRGLGIEAFQDFEDFVGLFGRTLEEMAANVFGALSVIFGGMVNAIFVLTIAIFLSLEEKGPERFLSLLFPKKNEAYVLSLWAKCQNKVSGWFLSRIFGSLFVGLASCLVLILFNVNYPFTLGLLAGTLNFIPFIGSLVAGLIIFIIIALTDIFQAIFVLVIFMLIQQIENNILMPVLTKKFIGMSPVLILLSLAVGGTLLGFLGAILAVPLAGILFEFFKEFLDKKRREEKAVIL